MNRKIIIKEEGLQVKSEEGFNEKKSIVETEGSSKDFRRLHQC